MKKKILAACLVVCLLATAVIGTTLAYFTDNDAKTNTFTVGNVDISLKEPNWNASGSADAPEVYPGEPLAKDPTVTNNGKNPCFVRIKVTGLDCLGEAGMITYRTEYVEDKLGENWERANDGYFYYNKVLESGGTTDALFDQIVIPTGLTNGSEDVQNKIVVTAEAVQAQGARSSWAAVQTMTVAEIQAWFDTVMASVEP